ncbi:MAG: endonuclease/exonuclease/phosphatase family protein [Dysgonamonadaceae bacterium]|nr:endonuclease/exonuclease/phosphatase family protein [Dysgonamonadaceae bacterium]
MNKVLLALFLFTCINLTAQSDFRIMFYNVENLFDTVSNPEKEDDDFTPGGFMNWTPWKYWEKQRNITRVITAVGGMHSPALIGLCEVENDSVLYDLTRRSPLRTQQYEFIITDSPDRRGINVALLYQRHQFNLLEHNEYEITFSNRNARPTRNILHAVGRIVNGDTLDVFVCHFPSRWSGQRETEPLRMEAAALLRQKVDSLFIIRQSANIVIMGDFNDYPNDRSMAQTLGAGRINNRPDSRALYNMFLHRMRERNFGTYKFQGQWGTIDHFIVSGNLLKNNHSTRVKDREAHIFKADFLFEPDETHGGRKPFRTNLGPRYIGGFSDHLPIFMDLIISR